MVVGGVSEAISWSLAATQSYTVIEGRERVALKLLSCTVSVHIRPGQDHHIRRSRE